MCLYIIWCMCLYSHACLFTCILVRTQAHVPIQSYIHMHLLVHVCKNIMCVCVCVYICRLASRGDATWRAHPNPAPPRPPQVYLGHILLGVIPPGLQADTCAGGDEARGEETAGAHRGALHSLNPKPQTPRQARLRRIPGIGFRGR